MFRRRRNADLKLAVAPLEAWAGARAAKESIGTEERRGEERKEEGRTEEGKKTNEMTESKEERGVGGAQRETSVRNASARESVLQCCMNCNGGLSGLFCCHITAGTARWMWCVFCLT